jgi:RHS repeat-associated protein
MTSARTAQEFTITKTPFGAVNATQTPYPWAFSFSALGKPLQYLNRNRFYRPGEGRFLSVDPVHKGNPYTYVGNSPLIFSDPYGLESCGLTIAKRTDDWAGHEWLIGVGRGGSMGLWPDGIHQPDDTYKPNDPYTSMWPPSKKDDGNLSDSGKCCASASCDEIKVCIQARAATWASGPGWCLLAPFGGRGNCRDFVDDVLNSCCMKSSPPMPPPPPIPPQHWPGGSY